MSLSASWSLRAFCETLHNVQSFTFCAPVPQQKRANYETTCLVFWSRLQRYTLQPHKKTALKQNTLYNHIKMQHSNKIKSHKKYSTQTKYNHFQMQHLNKIHFQTHNNAAAALKQFTIT